MKCPACRKSLWFVRTFCPFCKAKIIAPDRPTSVTAIGWVSLVLGGGVLAAFGLNFTSDAATEFRTQYPFMAARFFLGGFAALVCGAFMLCGVNWARWLFAGWFGYNALSQILVVVTGTSPVNLISPFLIGTAIYFLWRPASTAYFRQAPKVASEGGITGQPVCTGCGVPFAPEEMIRLGDIYSCARCKPLLIQRLREGATPL